MDRSRSKRNYYYDQDYDADSNPRSKPRFNNHYTPGNHRHRGNNNNNGGGGGGHMSRGPKSQQDSPTMVTTTYRILCHDAKAGGVIGKSGSIIKSIRQHTGAWVNVHELTPGDAERIIEISDTRRRDPDGRMPAFSPAQEALFLIHDRILESDAQFGHNGEPEEDYGGVRPGGGRVVTRLVVSRMHVGCLLGKGGKIIEQMRIETKTHIRILPRDHSLPRSVSMAEEIVQIVGDANAVKNAVSLISSRLRESQHRDRSNLQGRQISPERYFPPEDDYTPQGNNPARGFGSRLNSGNYRGNGNFPSRQSNFTIEAGSGPTGENARPYYGEDLVFQMLCPNGKVDSVIGDAHGIIDLLQNEVCVDIRLADPVPGSAEQIIVISSEEASDEEICPAQEALLHIQTRIVDIVPDKENIVTTRLLFPSSDIICLEGRDGSLSEIRRGTGANVRILPREDHPPCVTQSDEIVQIVGEIKSARRALLAVTSTMRGHMSRELFQNDATPTSINTLGGALGVEATSTNNSMSSYEGQVSGDPTLSTYQNVQTIKRTAEPSKEAEKSGVVKPAESGRREDIPSTVSRISVPFVTRSTLEVEVAIPQYATAKLITKSRNKLQQISELSGANVTLVEDRPEETQKTVRISGTPEQAERAQNLLQFLFLSTQEEDGA